jgi:hypothetical protein
MLCVTLIASPTTLTSGRDHVGGVAPEIAAAIRRTARWEAAIGVERSGIWIIAPRPFYGKVCGRRGPFDDHLQPPTPHLHRHADLDGDAHEVCDISRADSLHDPSAMVLDGLGADAELGADLLVR